MNISMKWLREYVDVDCDIDTFCDAMTMSGTNVETYEELGREITNVVVGKILEIQSHPDADKLVVTKVDVGDEVIQIVTGADNISEGDYVPVALPGAELAEGLKIKKGKLRGQESNGMMCSVEELGLSREDFSEAPEHGIYLFSEPKELGSDAKPLFGLGDIVVEYEVTSNRSDSFSVIGIAREVAATLNKPFNMPTIQYTPYPGDIQEKMKVVIEDTDRCYRFVGKVITEVNIQESPKWLKDRLRSCGIRPINNIVDITNFVMQEMGQPMHAYDLDLLDFNEIHVRPAKDDEILETLDGVKRQLDSSITVIADKEKAIGLAGIMGGQATKVQETTKTIFFEAATFNGTNIRKGSKKLGLRSDASTKFEKHLDPNLAEIAMERACQLIDSLGAGKVMEGIIDEYPVVRDVTRIAYDVDRINQIIGIRLSEDEMIDIFQRLDFVVEKDVKTVVIPTFRSDVVGIADLAEEVARLYGYDKIPTTLESGTPTVGKKNKKQKIEDITKQIMEACGISESMSYSFESPKAYDKLGIDKDHPLHQYVTISNPLGEDFSVMRTLTVNGMLNVLATNYNRRNENVRLYELGKTYVPKALPLKDYPVEAEFLTIGAYGDTDFFDIKGIVETLLNRLGIVDGYTYEADIELPFLHPGRRAKIMYNDMELGYLGEVHPDTAEQYDLGERNYIGLVNIENLTKIAKLTREYEPVAKYPAMHRDLALLVKEDILVGQIEFYIRQRGGQMLESYKLFDVYQGEQIEEGYKSVAYALTFRAKDHTLSEKEVTKAMDKILKGLEFELGVTLRK